MTSAINLPLSRNAYDGVLNSVSELLDTTIRLRDLDKLSKQLDPETVAKIKKTWDTVANLINNNQKFEVIKGEINKHLQKYFNTEQLESLKSIGDIIKFSKQFFTDLSSVITPPIFKPDKGNHGPTFLTSFIWKNRTHSFVIKWTDSLEVACNFIYTTFAHCLDADCKSIDSHGFYIPQIAGIDFAAHEYELPNGTFEHLSHSQELELHNIFLDITNRNAPYSNTENKQIMLSERITGDNLLDFAHLQYNDLFPKSISGTDEETFQKLKFFSRLGRIALLDMIIGNLDRFVPLILDKDEYSLPGNDYAANLGNVMILKTQEDYKIFLIDNGIYSSLVENKKNNENYNFFLETLFVKENFHFELAYIICISIQNLITLRIKENRKLKEQFSLFLKDLVEYGPEGLAFGISEMTAHIQTIRLEIDPIYKILAEKHCQLITLVQERLEMIKLISTSYRQDLSPSPSSLPIEASQIVNWLKLVRLHAKNYSREDQANLKRLAKNAPIEKEIPEWDCKPQILDLVQQVKSAVASSRAFTEQQSGKVIETLNLLSKTYPTLPITPEPPASDRIIRSPISFFSKEINSPTSLSCDHLAQPSMVLVHPSAVRAHGKHFFEV